VTARAALLALEDGSLFSGTGVGAAGTVTGEICFNTSMTGYQEVLTDPSYHGQIVAMTAPHIGNTGVNAADDQSQSPWVAGFVVRELARAPSSWRAEETLAGYLERHGVTGISGVDTRRLTRHVRTRGAMRATLSGAPIAPDDLVDIARSSPGMVGRDLVSEVTTSAPYSWPPSNMDGPRPPRSEGELERTLRVAAFDFGIKRNILDLLAARGCEVTVVPAHSSSHDVLAGGYDGVFLSNGPGDPEPLHHAIGTVRDLLGRLPVFGICLGHQILALALGGRTFKLPYGHRGGNHPVKRVECGRVEITCQNHGFAVDPASLARTQSRVTHLNLNDHTVEGLEVPGLCLGVQYHPEAAPGPHDSRYLFDSFRRLVESFTPAAAAGAG
jgi:carbamoyl-phosphate synthase small subunit